MEFRFLELLVSELCCVVLFLFLVISGWETIKVEVFVSSSVICWSGNEVLYSVILCSKFSVWWVFPLKPG